MANLIHCRKCGRDLDPSCFYKNPDGSPHPPCKECRRKRETSMTESQREKKQARDRAYAKRPEVRERRNRRRRENRALRNTYPKVPLLGKLVGEHRKTVLDHRGKILEGEVIHHIDHDPFHNDVRNLMVFASQSDHKRHEAGEDVDPVWRGDRCRCPAYRDSSSKPCPPPG